ncbi:hypothetical protein GGS23DRAFT_249538 [Durotheca rogersii]|uniref:uncharacterized protein n=1 Tax=Durotheca rogersii TaxID=419775 RepID=UPI00221FA0C5|nr:uncharacterized protein GGS23DRAFT_249538 [Durotheca rogersii]KAI5860105.1 hypothetical protein GGS23DRAFT_249538 [Durotheca rogersii]
MADTTKFKVIVVGGGPVGLTAAHALSRAGIDFVVLEHRESVVVDVGASLVLWPSGLRVLAQFGLLERLREIGADLRRTVTLTLDAHKYKDSQASRVVNQNHGTYPVIFHRADVVRLLYESLGDADRARVLAGKQVTDVVVAGDGVEARCADGSVHRGSVVLGADGVHSATRRAMRALAVAAGAPTVNDEQPYLTEYRTMWCTFPRPTDLGTGESIEGHGRDVSVQCLASGERSWLFVYERLAAPTRARAAYSAADVEALAARHADLPVSEHLRLRDVFPTRHAAGMANLEEGIVRHWSWGRVVLAGDACHKFTPNQGLGYNNGVQDVAALVNELHAVLRAGGGAPPPLDALSAAFARYQASRMASLQVDYDNSASFTRMSAWRNWIHHLLDRYILPWIPRFDEFMLTYIMTTTTRNCVVLNFVEGEEPFQGKVPWANAVKPPSIKLNG